MDIRRLHLFDAPGYRALRLRGLREHADAFTSSFEEEALRPLADTERRLASSAEKLWGAFAGGELVGMVGLSRETRLKCRHKATLVGMYVADEFAGRGWGRALVETVVREVRACGVALVVLTVTDGNQAACALYTRAGFATLGIEPDAIRVNGIGYGKRHMFLQLPAS
jgi:ribosomal protein S18 acetylase RimI-like enzyme